MNKGIKAIIVRYIENNLGSFILLIMAFTIGVSAGAFTVNALSETQRVELNNYFRGFLDLYNNQSIENTVIFNQSLVNNLKVVLVMWFLGATVVGIPLIFILIGIRGFITGFSVGFITNCIGASGILFSAISILPKDVLIVPCLLGLGVSGINFSRDILKSRTKKNFDKEDIKSSFIAYCAVTVVFSLVIICGVIAEAYISPLLIRIMRPLLEIR